MEEITSKKVLSVLKNINKLHVTQDDLSKNLSELGVDSMLFIEIVIALEEEFDCEIPDSKLILHEIKTIRDIIDILQDMCNE